jgi:hypothetical protein
MSSNTFTCAHCGKYFEAIRSEALYCPAPSNCRQVAWSGRRTAWRELGLRLAALNEIEESKEIHELALEAHRLRLLDPSAR